MGIRMVVAPIAVGSSTTKLSSLNGRARLPHSLKLRLRKVVAIFFKILTLPDQQK
jgi:hypothetical protein